MGGIGRNVIESFYAGDERASRIVFERYKKLIYFTLSSVLTSKEDVDDAYQEVFLKLFKSKPTFDDEGKGLPAYLVKAARSIAIDMAKKEARSFVADLENEEAPINPTLSLIVGAYLCPPLGIKEAEVVAYHAAFSLSFREIAEITGTPETTLRRIYKTSLKRIKEEYRK
jgi:RNA polymerase sigma factor (sigma-70 family)